MRKILSLTVVFVLALSGLAQAAWQQRAVFYPDTLSSHSWVTSTVTLPGCSTTSVILQKAKSPGTTVQLLYNPSSNATCQSAINKYLDQMVLRNPDSTGAVTFNK